MDQNETIHDDRELAQLMEARRRKPSRVMLGLFMLIFAVVGAVVIYRSFASETPPPAAPQAASAPAVKPSYDTPDFYGVNTPAETFPDARGADGDAKMTKLKADVAKLGSKWLRTDVSIELDRAYYQNTTCTGGLCDKDKMENENVLASIDHVTVRQVIEIDRLAQCKIDGLGGEAEFDPNKLTLPLWEKIVDCVSKRYKGKVKAYEIWNEPTVPDFKFAGGLANGTPENYFQMLKSAHTIIKRNDPAAIVVGLGGVEVFVGGEGAEARLAESKAFSQRVIALGGKSYADAISVHGYSWDVCSATVWDAYTKNTLEYKAAWGKDVWMTETGQRSDQSADPTCTQSKYYDYAYAAYINAGVKKVFAYALYNESAKRDVPAAKLSYGVAGKDAESFLKNYITAAKLGQLRVETAPAADASVSVHPGFTRTGNVAAETLQQGQYTLSFSLAAAPYTRKLPSQTNITITEKKLTRVTVDTVSDTASVVQSDEPTLATGFGKLQVAFTSAAGIVTSVHPGFVDTWGVNWREVDAGDYTFKLDYPAGSNAKKDGVLVKLPPETNLNLKSGTTTVVKVNTSTGIATIEPPINDASIPSAKAKLRIETVPAYGATISVHPGFVRQWGVNWESLAKGSYTIRTSYAQPYLGDKLVKLPPETNFEQSIRKISKIKIDITTGGLSTEYSWQ